MLSLGAMAGTPKTNDVLIIGGGVMGCALALRLAQAGARPTVLERAVPGAEASSVAAGILGPAVEAKSAGPMLGLALESRERHAELAAELLDAHGIDVGFRRCGVLRIAFDDSDVEALKAKAAMLEGAGVSVRLLSAEDTRALEPACNPEVAMGLELPEEAQLDPRALLSALSVAAVRAGAVFRTGATVRNVLHEGGRVRGVEVDGGTIEAPVVVVAAGSWTSLVPGLDLDAGAVRPVRGQIVAARTRPPVFRRIVFGPGGYVATRPDGRVFCGSTEEHVGFRREVTFGGLARVFDTACRIAPSLRDAPLEAQWSSFRPGTPDDLPLIGETGVKGVFVASGHYRNGILLSAITADLVTDLVLGRAKRTELELLDPKRFSSRK